jgi:hypothetical protein
MFNAITTIDTGTYLALADGGEIAEAMAANLGEGSALKESDLTRVRIPSSAGTQWTVPGLLQDEITPSLDGILVYQCVRGVLWAGDEPEEGSLPLMVTDDLKIGRLVADNPPQNFLDAIEPHRIVGTDHYKWSDIPQNQWGSGKNGEGKRCKEQRVLFILRETEPLPLVVTIQPGSLKNWQQFIVALTKAGIPYWRAVITLTLEKDKSATGVAYSKVVPQLVGTLTKEQGDVIREKFTETMRAVAQSSFAA